jgi:hypothetical protein
MQNSTSDSKAPADPTNPSQPAGLSEGEFLAAHAAAARGKFTDRLQQLQDHLKDCADVPAWTRKYPWPSLGIAAALGFLAGTAVTGKRSKPNLDDLLAEALAAKAATAASTVPKPSMMAGLVGQLVGSLIGALEGAIAGAFSSKMAAANTPEQNGAAEATDSGSDSAKPDDPA